MRLFAAFALVSLLAAADKAPNPQLEQVHKVYLLAMGGGLDQYLANQITSKGVLEVVTDAKLADAVFTDSIGADFEARLTELLPPPAEAVVVTDPKKAKDKDKSGEAMSYVTTTRPRSSSFGRGRGNLFLVDLKTRSVVWSTSSVPKNRTPVEFGRTSERMTDALAKAFGRGN